MRWWTASLSKRTRGKELTIGERQALGSAHDRHYRRLFEFLDERNKSYAAVDVRENNYTRLGAVVGRPPMSTPFRV
jgi:hypothetical protein